MTSGNGSAWDIGGTKTKGAASGAWGARATTGAVLVFAKRKRQTNRSDKKKLEKVDFRIWFNTAFTRPCGKERGMEGSLSSIDLGCFFSSLK